ncbi:MAG: endonuclease III domain-containing protein [Ignavibacteria bacterium]
MLKKINQIIRLLQKEFPDLSPKPDKSDPLDVLIATMLSQNTTDKTSYRAFRNLRKQFKNWNKVIDAPISRIKNAIKVCGLANQKAKNIRDLLAGLKNKYGKLSLNFIEELSDDEIYNELMPYKGIGVKTVSCVLAFGLGRDVFPVDTHVHRLCSRLGLASARTPDKTFSYLLDKIPKGKKFLLHTLLIRFGRKICRANNPLCGKCILYDLCEFKEKEYFAERTLKTYNAPRENNFIILEHV